MTTTGAAANDDLGLSVSSAGDFNGDGYADVIVSAHLNDAGGTNAGRAYIYFGGPGADAVPDLILTGEAAGDTFGYAVAGAGDVNGDGFDDVIIGAPANGAGGSNAGRAYVFFGGPHADSVPDLILTGAAAGDNFGDAVASAGDVNGDGFADVIVGALLNDAGGANAGRAYVFYGGPAADNVADLTLTGAAAGDQFGKSVSSAGDVNGDGKSDVIVGAPYNDTGGTDAGRAYVYYGGPGADATPDLTLTGAAAGNLFGWSVSRAGDVNGDGKSDVIVGAPLNDAGGTDAGRAYVYYGGPGADATPDLTLTGQAAGDQFGVSVSRAGDVNGDGYADIIVGSLVTGASNIGRASIFFGGPSPDNVADFVIGGFGEFDSFGICVATAGDVNGDGATDVIIGAPNNDAGGTDAGRAYVFGLDRSPVAAVNLFTTTFNVANQQAGSSVAAAGDFNGDGYGDAIAGVRGGFDHAYMYFGGPALDATPDLTLRGLPGGGENFGCSVSGAGQFNADGYADVIVGAFSYSGQTGRAYVFYGGASADSVPDLTLTGAATGDRFGIAVAGGGDFNGDGYDDVLVGADLNDAGGTDAGRAYIYYGGPGADSTPDVILTGQAAGDQFGHSVAFAGDINGDGFDDVIVGAPLNGAAGLHAGRAYIYYGGTTPHTTPDLILTGAASSDQLGNAVAPAGDVNGDGKADVIVGAWNASVFGKGGTTGHAYVFFGGASPDSIPDLTFTGEAGSDEFGFSVSSGDVNGDGFSDLIAAAPGHNSNTGRSYVYYGGPAPDNTADIIQDGEAAVDQFGWSVSTAGDLNGDGLADWIVGAPQNDAGASNAGRGYVYSLDRRPIVASPAVVPTEEKANVSFNVGASDPEGGAITSLTANLTGLPPGNDATFTPSGNNKSGTFTWHPAVGMAGTYSVVFTAANTLSGTDTTVIRVAALGATVTGTFNWTPTAADIGTHDVTFRASNTNGESTTATTHITVSAPPSGAASLPKIGRRVQMAPQRGPIVSYPQSTAIYAGNTLEFSVSATFSDTLTMNTNQLPPDNTASLAVDHDPIVIAPPSLSVDPTNLVTFTVTASDPDTTDVITGLTADTSGLPPGNNAVFTPNGSHTSGTFTWTPTVSDSGNFVVVFRAANALAESAPTVISVGNKLHGYWTLDGSGADGAAQNPLAATGNVSYATGEISQAADISGPGAGRLAAPATGTSYDLISSGFTYECWVKVRSLAYGIDPRIAFAGTTSTPSYWEIHVCDEGCTTGTVKVRAVTAGGTTELQSNVNINNNAWHHLAVTYDGAKLRLYVDGVLDDSLAQSGLSVPTGGGTFALGARPAGENQFDGLIDEVRIWARPRTQAQIQANMNRELGFPTSVEGGTPRFVNQLGRNRPNPFNPATEVAFEVAREDKVRIAVFDVRGRMVAVLFDGEAAAGIHRVTWNGQDSRGMDASSGVYFYRMEMSNFRTTRKMTLLR